MRLYFKLYLESFDIFPHNMQQGELKMELVKLNQ